MTGLQTCDLPIWLVRAYGGTAAECLRRAGRVALVDMRELALHAPFEDLGTVHAALAAASAEKLSETFDPAGTRLLLRLPADDGDALKLRLREIGRATCRERVCQYVANSGGA